MRDIQIQALTAEAFAPFGDILEARGTADKIINQGNCGRHHDLAKVEAYAGEVGISVFDAKPYALPLTLEMMERHPDGSQAFIPMHSNPYLVIVASNENGAPAKPLAFRAENGQGINYHRNIWHGVLCPLSDPGLFAVVDRIGSPNDERLNLEEYWFDDPWIVRP